MIYLGYLLLLMLLLMLERQQASINNIYRYLIPILYILLIGLRGANVGVDTAVYYDHYYTFGQWGCDFVEVGFDWINRFCYHHGWSQAPFFVICAAFAIVPVTCAINSHLSRNEYSIFMLLFCTTTFVSFCNGMRQSMACGIFFWLIFMFEESSKLISYKFFVYVIVVFLASLFHASVLLVSPLVLLYKINLSNKNHIIIYLCSFIFIFINISSYLPDIELGGRDYGRYLGGELMNKSASSLGFLITTLRNILVLTLLIKFDAFKKYALLADMAFLMLVFTNLGFNIPLAGRINMYFTPFYTLMSAMIIVDNRNSLGIHNKPFVWGLIIIIVVLSVYSIISPANRVLPYTFCWENSNYSNYFSL